MSLIDTAAYLEHCISKTDNIRLERYMQNGVQWIHAIVEYDRLPGQPYTAPVVIKEFDSRSLEALVFQIHASIKEHEKA